MGSIHVAALFGFWFDLGTRGGSVLVWLVSHSSPGTRIVYSYRSNLVQSASWNTAFN